MTNEVEGASRRTTEPAPAIGGLLPELEEDVCIVAYRGYGDHPLLQVG